MGAVAGMNGSGSALSAHFVNCFVGYRSGSPEPTSPASGDAWIERRATVRAMPEGLSPAEVGKEIAEHKKRLEEQSPNTQADGEAHRQDRWLSILEAILLSLVAVLAAYSGYAAAKWGTESSVTLAKASAERTKANREDIEGIVTRTLDSASFNAWFTAFTAGNANAEQLAIKRLRPGYRPAFFAWLATDPAHNPNAPLVRRT